MELCSLRIYQQARKAKESSVTGIKRSRVSKGHLFELCKAFKRATFDVVLLSKLHSVD